MGNCCSTIPDIESRFPAIGIVDIGHENEAPDAAVQAGPDVEQFENLNFTDSSSVDAEMEHLSKLLESSKAEPKAKSSGSKKKKN
ncbi:hypothetical protein TVAG_288860 [Trichomonas vaginalis G3]|uniref:Uncharacterized protein n=1 Tax=Trichomonas vaginalis (strain ATCC PRA-98 / G3) TaxID=412133 RepID=A2ERE1_TRIV3|nr:hypothetical protein TVAGG3_0127770 [Trichomonas vaginalis G3]EAY04744.1 hypothetical protein TVAG_288860 [Trichomonas vaginalis G3]KAI5545886.1 hypothetical protein TVAGG3_0127770 [Trichomonas vaginalis G3]|eukprot:XP_001316967.1 hypothetical protein [Trichomonas vaginalis G3]